MKVLEPRGTIQTAQSGEKLPAEQVQRKLSARRIIAGWDGEVNENALFESRDVLFWDSYVECVEWPTNPQLKFKLM